MDDRRREPPSRRPAGLRRQIDFVAAGIQYDVFVRPIGVQLRRNAHGLLKLVEGGQLQEVAIAELNRNCIHDRGPVPGSYGRSCMPPYFDPASRLGRKPPQKNESR
jgi:hypothetical protein